VYTITNDIHDVASQLARDIANTVSITLGQLRLPMFPDV